MAVNLKLTAIFVFKENVLNDAGFDMICFPLISQIYADKLLLVSVNLRNLRDNIPNLIFKKLKLIHQTSFLQHRLNIRSVAPEIFKHFA